MTHELKNYDDVRRGDFLWSPSLNRWVMVTEKPVLHVIRGARVHRFQAITPSGDLANVSEEGEPGSAVSPVATVHADVPEQFDGDVMDERLDKIRRQIGTLTEMIRNLATVEVFATQAIERLAE